MMVTVRLKFQIIQQKLVLEQDNHRNTQMTMNRKMENINGEMENMKKAMSRDIDNLRNANMVWIIKHYFIT